MSLGSPGPTSGPSLPRWRWSRTLGSPRLHQGLSEEPGLGGLSGEAAQGDRLPVWSRPACVPDNVTRNLEDDITGSGRFRFAVGVDEMRWGSPRKSLVKTILYKCIVQYPLNMI